MTTTPANITITTDTTIEITTEDNELPLSLDLPTWLVLAASGPALKLAHLIVLLHRQPPADRQVTHDLLAAILGKSVDRVTAYVKELEATGWLTVIRRRVSGWQVPNEYRYRHTPPADRVVPRTVDDLMAIADSRRTRPVDNTETAGQHVPAKMRPRHRRNAATTTTDEETSRSARTRKNAATTPQKRGPYKELTSCTYRDSIDRANDDTAPNSEPATPAPSEAARDLVRTLPYGRHPMPSAADVDMLAGLVDTATAHGLTLFELRLHCRAAVDRARDAVVPYLVGALSPAYLPAPRPTPNSVPSSGSVPPVCGKCHANPPDPISWRVVVDAEGVTKPCPRCHPDALRVASTDLGRCA